MFDMSSPIWLVMVIVGATGQSLGPRCKPLR